MGKVVNWQFGDALEFKHPICSDCRGNTFAVEISENDDIILHCVKCFNIIDFQISIVKRKSCCKWPDYCGGECTCKICAPDLHIGRLEYELEECKCIKSSYFDNSIKCDQDNKSLRARNAELEAEVERLWKAINVTHLMLLEGKYGSATIEIGQALEASDG